MDDATYITKHTDKCGGCVELEAPNADLERILESGKIPIVATDRRKGGYQLLLRPHEVSRGYIPYIAISHVWADGLGNPSGNVLPYCQIRRLRKYTSAFENAETGTVVHYWLDTLCVPPDSAGTPATQMRAMHKMRDTYAKANYVLVLDAWLLNTVISRDVSIPGVPDLILRVGTRRPSEFETLARIVVSPWTRRLWTLQEGALANKDCLFFAFASGLINGDKVFCPFTDEDVWGEKEWPWALQGLFAQAVARYAEIRGWPRPDVRQKRQSCISRMTSQYTGDDQIDISSTYIQEERLALYCTMSALRSRSTSVAHDEPLCLAVLLDLDIHQVTAVPEEDRMAKLWSLIPRVPVDVLTWDLERINQYGLGWAPASFLDAGRYLITSFAPVGHMPAVLTVSSDGLLGNMSAMIFEIEYAWVAGARKWLIRRDDGNTIIATHENLASGPEPDPFTANLDSTRGLPGNEVYENKALRRLMFHHLFGPEFAILLPRAGDDLDAQVGITVQIIKRESECYIARYLHRSALYGFTRDVGQMRKLNSMATSGVAETIEARSLPPETAWTIV